MPMHMSYFRAVCTASGVLPVMSEDLGGGKDVGDCQYNTQYRKCNQTSINIRVADSLVVRITIDGNFYMDVPCPLIV